jgi:drug/metabolite transporter (DMT)-like permease
METEVLAGKPVAPVFAEKQAEQQLAWHWAALAAILFASAGHLLIKFGLISSAQSAVGLSTAAKIVHYLLQPAVAAGLAIYGLGTLFWITAVSRRDISFLYPITALNYVIVSLGGKFFFGEAVSTGRWLGIAVVVAGVALLQFSVKGERA